MEWIKTGNNRTVKISDVPNLKIEGLRQSIIEQCSHNCRVVALFGIPSQNDKVYAVLADDAVSQLYIASAVLGAEKKYDSITPQVPSFHNFERELYEETGIEPVGHPWLKPVRYSSENNVLPKEIVNYPFFKMSGDEIHEVAVGPVHAGIIEPGHFRFMCHGEKLYHLEIQLGYQHRGIEQLMRDNYKFMPQIAESIVGDSVIAHTTAYVNSIETLGCINVPERAVCIRDVALELERIAVHIGDLGAIANDIAYLPGSAVFGATRTLVINTMMEICGSRFGRGLIIPGGVAYDIDEKLREKIKTILKKVNADVGLMCDVMFDSASVLSRLEKTGIVDKETALKIGMVGMSARASGVPIDSRSDHAYGTFKKFKIKKMVLAGGDVFARSYIRFIEIKESSEYIYRLLDSFPSGDISVNPSAVKLSADSMVVSITEGWRGEVVHIVLTGHDGGIIRYKIKDPSFNNWFALALAVRNNGISDFPLCNKSFNLSYCGNDL